MTHTYAIAIALVHTRIAGRGWADGTVKAAPTNQDERTHTHQDLH
jgi:hypothetical protein